MRLYVHGLGYVVQAPIPEFIELTQVRSKNLHEPIRVVPGPDRLEVQRPLLPLKIIKQPKPVSVLIDQPCVMVKELQLGVREGGGADLKTLRHPPIVLVAKRDEITRA